MERGDRPGGDRDSELGIRVLSSLFLAHEAGQETTNKRCDLVDIPDCVR